MVLVLLLFVVVWWCGAGGGGGGGRSSNLLEVAREGTLLAFRLAQRHLQLLDLLLHLVSLDCRFFCLQQVHGQKWGRSGRGVEGVEGEEECWESWAQGRRRGEGMVWRSAPDWAEGEMACCSLALVAIEVTGEELATILAVPTSRPERVVAGAAADPDLQHEFGKVGK